MTALSVRNLVKSYGGRPVVKDVSFDLAPGEVLGLVGESGSGKSTVARCVARLTRPNSGQVLLGGRDVLGASHRELRTLRRDVQMVFQDPYSSLNPRMTAGALVGEGLLVHGLEPDSRRRTAKAAALLETVGLSAADAVRHPRSFSGGQRQRIAIARALAVEPKVLICDEVVSSLDVSVQAQVLNLFRDLRERLDLSILFIAHDLAVVHYLCDRVAVLDQGVLVETGTREEIYRSPRHPYTRSLLDAVPVPDPAAERARQTT
ncbi:phosphonate C-P lyase system protein PhnK [Actinomadura coerulea]|uniref:Phosphonate C-P lyase system protein PhnK n=1 Tax=Actinomadura coerulea TaxID=46159 RepID=A0A7X0KYN4_9ACTN|nr:ATP-binding cassette domain-containing protein [Actinomadura coerulea]MBB6395596.1 phosphonate C-P lyase system protein PhnK [Actinomadura coerulea]GGQ25232.1 peptide ABC transporter ATP-binding protein [Actinomadura coerulea]